ncbi:hypothetical protein [Streptomyces sp. NPDC056663]|uniref:hypothetical protein n=1 Tax=Streptomyces sp. NPDC056663 TaxID=3345899 RepID=UPI00368B5044
MGVDRVGGTEQDIASEYAKLQKMVRARHAEVVKHSAGDDQFAVEYARLVSNTERLLQFERTIPERFAEPQLRLSQRTVTWSWWGQAVVGAVLIALVFILGHTLWWLVLLVPHFLGVLAGSAQKVGSGDHVRRRSIAVGLHIVGVLVVLVSLSVISSWFLVAIFVGWIAVAIATSQAPAESGKKGGRA